MEYHYLLGDWGTCVICYGIRYAIWFRLLICWVLISFDFVPAFQGIWITFSNILLLCRNACRNSNRFFCKCLPFDNISWNDEESYCALNVVCPFVANVHSSPLTGRLSHSEPRMHCHNIFIVAEIGFERMEITFSKLFQQLIDVNHGYFQCPGSVILNMYSIEPQKCDWTFKILMLIVFICPVAIISKQGKALQKLYEISSGIHHDFKLCDPEIVSLKKPVNRCIVTK